MFWEQLKAEEANVSHIMKQKELTVLEVLDHRSTPQEVRFMSEELFAFFNSKERISELLRIALSEQSAERKERSETAVQILKGNNGGFLPSLFSDPNNVNVLCEFLDADGPINWYLMSMFGALISAGLENCPIEVLTMMVTRKEMFCLLKNRISYPVIAKIIAEMIVLCSTNQGVLVALGRTCLEDLLAVRKLPELLSIPDAQFTVLFEQMYLQWRDYLLLNDELLEFPQVHTILSGAFIDGLCTVMFRPNTSEEKDFPYESEAVFVEGCGALYWIIKMVVALRDFRMGKRALSNGNGPTGDIVYNDCEALGAIVQKAGPFFSLLERAHSIKRDGDFVRGVPPFREAYFGTMRLFHQLAVSNAREIDEPFAERMFKIITEAFDRYCTNCYVLNLASLTLMHLSCSTEGDSSREELTPFIGILLISGEIFKFVLQVRDESEKYKKEHGRFPASYDFIMPIAWKVDDVVKEGIGSIFQLPDNDYANAWNAFVQTDLSPYQNMNVSLVKRAPAAPKVSTESKPVLDVIAEEQLAQKRSEFIMQLMNKRIPEAYGVSVESIAEDSDTENNLRFQWKQSVCHALIGKRQCASVTISWWRSFVLAMLHEVLSLTKIVQDAILDDANVSVSVTPQCSRLAPRKKSKLVNNPSGVTKSGKTSAGTVDAPSLKVHSAEGPEMGGNDEKIRPTATLSETSVANQGGSTKAAGPFISPGNWVLLLMIILHMAPLFLGFS
ncbi:hypothetical protein TTRE_0000175601 [Trichuris trichiura]|uniref:Uncharacterized protein n=1 Tax=Trichuris trichiura TaxID=36087 RepID=A0A077Z0B5_TRITR|nr:hypothetical protein TTRE_0000175601 [Trichuris trichiura]